MRITKSARITVRALRGLLAEAELVGDDERIVLCEQALAGDTQALAACVEAILLAEDTTAPTNSADLDDTQPQDSAS